MNQSSMPCDWIGANFYAPDQYGFVYKTYSPPRKLTVEEARKQRIDDNVDFAVDILSHVVLAILYALQWICYGVGAALLLSL